MLIDVSLRGPDKDGGNVALDFSVVTPAAMTYCAKSATIPLHAAELRERAKIQIYAEAYMLVVVAFFVCDAAAASAAALFVWS